MGIEIVFYISIGYYLSLAFYHFVIYSGRKSDPTILSYSILLLSLTLSIFVKGLYVHIERYNAFLAPYLSFNSLNVVGLSLIVFASIALTAGQHSKSTKIFFVYSVIICSLSTLFFDPSTQYSLMITTTTIMIVPAAIFLASRMIVYFFKNPNQLYKEQWRFWIFIGTVVYTISFFTAIPLKSMGYPAYIQALTLNIGAFFLSSLSAFSLAVRFNNEHKELAETKRDLEARIIDRTRDLQSAKDQIELQSREKTAYFINLAHETRTPAMLIQNYLEKCRYKYPEDVDLAIVKDNVDKLVRDMVNFLDSEKIEQGRLTYEDKKQFSLTEFMNKKADLITPTAESCGIKINREIYENVNITSSVYALDRIFNNLLDNAMRYTRRGGSISMVLKPADENGDITILISDTGVGIPDERKKYVFDKFYQVSHTKGNTQGMGMGLYIVKGIIEELGGKIFFDSSEKGTCFTVKLPNDSGGEFLSLSEATLTAPVISLNIDSPVENMPVEEKKETVLIVEDNRKLILSMRETLNETYNVLCAGNGKEALNLLERHSISAIISDIMMDEMDGYALLEEVRKSDQLKEIPFVFITARTGTSEEIRGLKYGAVEYIQKPFSMEILKARIGALIAFNHLKHRAFELEKFHSVGMITASICHEIINPLSGIEGPLYVIEQNAGKDEKKFTEGINHIKTNVTRISNIVSTMRSLFHGEGYSMEKVEVSTVIESIVKIFEDRSAGEISYNIDLPSGMQVKTNKSAFTHILMNLISNATDSIVNGGKVTISGKNESSKVITITDTGSGIPQQNLSKIFELAFSTKRESGGTGLGLYIVKELAERLGIRINVKSELNKGSEFTLVFPEF